MRRPCLGCGRDTLDRHRYCWNCRQGGLSARLLDDYDEWKAAKKPNGVCTCANPRPERIGGIWVGLALRQCSRCGKKVTS
jgi:hypothetical protein